MAAEPGLTTFELLSIIGAVGGGTAAVCVFIFSGANSIRKEFYRGLSRITKWQSRHERRDERRFTIMDNRISEIVIRNSIKDGNHPPKMIPVNDIVRAMERDDDDDEEDD